METKQTLIIRLWNEGQSVDGIVAAVKLAGLTRRNGSELSKTAIKMLIRGYIAGGLIKKRPVIQNKKVA